MYRGRNFLKVVYAKGNSYLPSLFCIPYKLATITIMYITTPGGILDISLGGEVQLGLSYSDPVQDKYR